MSLAETLEKSDFQMNEADRAEFVERVLVDGEEIVAAFRIISAPKRPQSVVFTSKRLILENFSWRSGEPDRGRTDEKLIFIPYRNIALHEVETHTTYTQPPTTTGVLKVWVAGYDLNVFPNYFNIECEDKIDAYLLSRILASQMEM